MLFHHGLGNHYRLFYRLCYQMLSIVGQTQTVGFKTQMNKKCSFNQGEYRWVISLFQTWQKEPRKNHDFFDCKFLFLITGQGHRD